MAADLHSFEAQTSPQDKTRLAGLIDRIDACIEYFLFTVLVLGVFYPWEVFINPPNDAALNSSTVSDSAGGARVRFLVLLLLTLYLFLKRFRGVFLNLRFEWPFIVLCVWILLSTTWAPDHLASFNTSIRLFAPAMFSFYLAGRYNSLELTRFLTRGFMVAVLASCAVMLAAYKLGLSNMNGADYATAWRGAFIHKNNLGPAMSLGLVVATYSYLKRANSRVLSGATILGCLFLLVMSRSATSEVATAASVLVAVLGFAIQSRRWPFLRVIAILGISVAAVMAMLIYLEIIDISLKDFLHTSTRSADLTGRTEIWHAVWNAIRFKPITGYGYGFWEQASNVRSNIWLAVDWQAPHAHNNWLDTALQLGFVGVLISAAIYLSAFRRALWMVIAGYGNGALLFLVILANCFVRSFAETITLSPMIAAFFWWVISYVYIRRISHERKTAHALAALSEQDLSLFGRARQV